MKNIIFTCSFFFISNYIFAQEAPSATNILFSKPTEAVKPADCYGEWTSTTGEHLILYNNNKAVWKDEGHVYYMTWKIEANGDNDNSNIVLLGNERCKHTALVIRATDNGTEIVEEQTNLHLHFSKEVTATLQ